MHSYRTADYRDSCECPLKVEWLHNLLCSLSDNQIGDGGANAIGDALAINTTLQKLWQVSTESFECVHDLLFSLYNNRIGDDGAKRIAGALASNCTLQELS